MSRAGHPRLRPGRAGAAAAVLLLAPVGAAAQIPEKFTNLQVLPKSTTQADLIQTMRWFAGALGVRCNHCHVGVDVETLEGFEFASDEKETKRVARGMMRMVQEINDRRVPATGRATPHRVSRITCHRGAAVPQTLHERLIETVAKDGVDAALTQYRSLREKHFGGGTYDFGPQSLSVLAEHLARERNDLDGALAAARLNVEFHPAEPNVHVLVGRICFHKGDREGAAAAFGKAADLAPGDAWIREQLEALKAPLAPPGGS